MFLREEPLAWDVTKFSFWFGTRYGVSSLALLVALPLAQRAGASDHVVCAAGIVSKMAGLLLLAFSTNTAMGFSGKGYRQEAFVTWRLKDYKVLAFYEALNIFKHNLV